MILQAVASGLALLWFVFATPTPNQKRAAVVHLGPGRFNPESPDPEVLRRDAARVASRHFPPTVTTNAEEDIYADRRRAVPRQPFDIARRKETSVEGLIDDFTNLGFNQLWYGFLSGVAPPSFHKRGSPGLIAASLVGTPPQVTTVEFDTGSANLWLASTECDSCFGSKFDPGLSTSFRDTQVLFNSTYNDGSVALGTLAEDSVNMAGFVVSSQVFGSVTSASGIVSGIPAGGIIGLAFDAGPPFAYSKPFFLNLVAAGSLASNVFSFYLVPWGSPGSEVCLGCIDSTKYTGDINWNKLDPNPTGGTQVYWNIPSKGISHNGDAVTEGWSVIIDTGTTGIFLPTVDAQNLYSNIPSSFLGNDGFWYYPCGTEVTGFSIEFGGVLYPLDSRSFNLGPAQNGSSICHGGVFGSPITMATVGVEFLMNWYTVFDYDSLSVGFAQIKQGE